jgi:hypothetical protein
VIHLEHLSVVCFGVIMTLAGCRRGDESRAEVMCEKAKALEKENPRAALALKRHIYEEMPTAGTRAARVCLEPIRTRMGAVRVLISEDERGDRTAIEGCIWAADVMEVFARSVSPPFKRRWARRLMERCTAVVGRAWTRAPDDETLMVLSTRFSKLSK